MTLLFPNLTLAFCHFSEAKHYHPNYAIPFQISRNLPDLSAKRSLNKRNAKKAKCHLGQRNGFSNKDYTKFKFSSLKRFLTFLNHHVIRPNEHFLISPGL